MPRPNSPPLLLPRGLIFLASIWLIGSWMLSIGLRPPVQPSSASYMPGVRMMLLCVITGLMIGWPLLRLSQDRPPYPIAQTLLDLVVLVGLVQVVVWPLRLVTTWTTLRTAAIDATLIGWLLLAGAVVAGAITSNRAGPRNAAMLVCLIMCLGGPIATWLGSVMGIPVAGYVAQLGPIAAVHELGSGGGAQMTTSQWLWILLLGIAAVVVWLEVGIMLLIAKKRSRSNNNSQQAAPSADVSE